MRGRRFFLSLVVAPCWVIGKRALAQDRPPTPTRLAGGRVISPQEAQALLASGKAVFIDTRSPVNFAKGHVPGARTVAYKEKSEFVENFDATLDAFDFDKLPPDKQAYLVFYSDGLTGWKSYKAAVLAIRKGYAKVHYLRSGWAGWQAAKLPVQE
jgi:rhodanese-related sulfurtransferase